MLNFEYYGDFSEEGPNLYLHITLKVGNFESVPFVFGVIRHTRNIDMGHYDCGVFGGLQLWRLEMNGEKGNLLNFPQSRFLEDGRLCPSTFYLSKTSTSALLYTPCIKIRAKNDLPIFGLKTILFVWLERGDEATKLVSKNAIATVAIEAHFILLPTNLIPIISMGSSHRISLRSTKSPSGSRAPDTKYRRQRVKTDEKRKSMCSILSVPCKQE